MPLSVTAQLAAAAPRLPAAARAADWDLGALCRAYAAFLSRHPRAHRAWRAAVRADLEHACAPLPLAAAITFRSSCSVPAAV